jgi:hypothetical protein
MNIVRKTTFSALAALMVITAAATVAPTQAQAGGSNLGLFVAGAFLGGLAVATQPRYNPHYPGHAEPVYGCRPEWETHHNAYGQAYRVQTHFC